MTKVTDTYEEDLVVEPKETNCVSALVRDIVTGETYRFFDWIVWNNFLKKDP